MTLKKLEFTPESDNVDTYDLAIFTEQKTRHKLYVMKKTRKDTNESDVPSAVCHVTDR